MIKLTFGLTREPFFKDNAPLLPQQTDVIEMIKIHAQHGGFSVIVGHPGVGKSVVKNHIEQWAKNRDTVVVSFTQTLHTYSQILRLLGDSMGVSASANHLEAQLVQAAFKHAQANKNLYILIDEAHLLDVTVLRKLRLLFERFPKRHNWVLLGHPELLTRLSLMCNEDIKSRISYSKTILPLSPIDLRKFIETECTSVGLANNTFDEAAIELITRVTQGNLRLCSNLCYASLLATCLAQERVCTVSHVNNALIQPHWRSHDALLKQQVKEVKKD
jgi:type II secretory pathway predicted ATPase ExeA